MSAPSRYEQRGVSSSKPDVQAAIAKLNPGIFPNAFCKIIPDHLVGDPERCCLQHADGAGTKSSLAYLYWKETGDLSVWKGIARDSLFMNLDDAGCVGALGPFLVFLTIGRNKALIPGEVITTIVEETQAVCDMLTRHGVPCHFTGGETADIGDLVRTIVVDNTITTRMKRSEVIDAGRIAAPAFIVGFSTTGQASYEESPNSSMGSNGLTNARHEMLGPGYRAFTATYAPETSPDLIYCGRHNLTDPLPGDEQFTIGTAMLSPTRTYLPLVRKVLERVGRENILGFIHCSGGGQTKIGKFGQAGITYVKDTQFPVPPLFKALQEARQLSWREMYETCSMGHRYEAVVPTIEVAEACIEVSATLNIEGRLVGRVHEGRKSTSGERTVVIKTPDGDEYYEF